MESMDNLCSKERAMLIQRILSHQSMVEVPIRYHAAHLSRLDLPFLRKIQAEYSDLVHKKKRRNYNAYRGRRQMCIHG